MADNEPASPNGQVPVPVKDPNMGGGSFGPIPMMSYGLTFRELGSSGLRAFAGYVREEFLPALQGRQGQTVYREMADNSAVIGAMIASINATMLKVDWRTEPADDTPAAAEAAEFADSLREDMKHTWQDAIIEGLSMVPYGYAPLEINYKRRLGQDPGMDPKRPGKRLPSSKYDDGRIGWKSLPIRGQDTVIKWFFDENGEVEGLTQQPWVGPLLDIPIEKLLLFRPSQHKNNPEGRSVIRNAYRSYYMVKRIEEQEAILSERMNGLPVIKVPGTLIAAEAAGDADAALTMESYRAIARNLRIDEQMGVVLPSDMYDGPTGGASSAPAYSIELVAPGGGKGAGGPDSTTVIMRHNNLILMSVLADFLTLGHGPTGTQALADTKQGLFFQAVEGYLNGMAQVFNRHGLRRIWALNGMDFDLMPEFQPDLAQPTDLDMLGNYVQRLGASGMALFPNAELESALMDAAGLPDVSEANAASLLAVGADIGPMAIAGPQAAAAVQQVAPPPKPEPGSPRDQFEKMIMGSIARRVMKAQGPTMPIDTMRKRNLPKPRGTVLLRG